ncbi:TetR/AcrR family transcriptional regulator [Baekduia sp. Peel2402]|uniref:TetR/AcrR family transcriptional regulator n=1 Tax=Baekduia sp. Peel2402 TaxID=3458296 RepID=UPI00403ED175
MASAESEKPLRADARRNRERIVDAAGAVFAQCGAAAQMDDVARRACVGVGTVYRHFPTKQALLGELLAAKFRGHAEIARKWAVQDDGWTAFEGFLRETFAQVAEDATLQQRVHWVDDDEALAIAAVERNVVVEVLGGIIERAKAQETLRASFTVGDIPAVMCAVGAVMAMRHRPEIDADAFVDLLIGGLRA